MRKFTIAISTKVATSISTTVCAEMLEQKQDELKAMIDEKTETIVKSMEQNIMYYIK